MDSEIKNRTNRIISTYKESTDNYWSTLLTANTLIVSIFSGISILSNYKIIPAVIVVSSLISSFLLIQNSRTVKEVYKYIGEKILQNEPADDIANKDIENAIQKNKEVKKREKIIEIILVLEALLILLAIFWGLLDNLNKQTVPTDSIISQTVDDGNIDQENIKLPGFQDYVADDYLTGEPVSVNLDSHPRATTFRTRITEATKEEPNFADKYTIATWGCGTGCQESAIIDRGNGEVYFPELNSQELLDFRLDSKLIIVNPIQSIFEAYGSNIEDIPEYLTTRYYLWEDNELKLLKEVRATYKLISND